MEREVEEHALTASFNADMGRCGRARKWVLPQGPRQDGFLEKAAMTVPRRRAGLQAGRDVPREGGQCESWATGPSGAVTEVQDGDPRWGWGRAAGRGLRGNREAKEGPAEAPGLEVRARFLYSPLVAVGGVIWRP